MNLEKSGYDGKNELEKKEVFPHFDVKEALKKQMEKDIDLISEDSLFSAIAYPDNEIEFEETVNEMDKDLKDSRGNKIERKQIEKMLKMAQLSFLVDKAVLQLLMNNPMELTDFKADLSLITFRSANINRLVVAYDSMLREHDIDKRIQKRLEEDQNDVIDKIDQYRFGIDEVKQMVRQLKFIQQGIKDGVVVSCVEGVDNLEDVINVIDIPFADIVMHLSPGRVFKYVGKLDSSELPSFVNRESGNIMIKNLDEDVFAEAEIYLLPKPSQNRFLVISNSGRNWYEDPGQATNSVRHEVEHVVNRIINKKLRENFWEGFDQKSLAERIEILDRWLMDELDAGCVGGNVDLIKDKAYFGYACRKLDRSLEINKEEGQDLAEKFKIRWGDVIYLLRNISKMTGQDRAGILMVHHIVSRVRDVNELLENLRTYNTWLEAESKLLD